MQDKHTIEINPLVCLSCGTRSTVLQGVHGEGVLLSPGDTAACQECGHLMAFDNKLRFRELTAEERDIVSMDTLIIPTQCNFDEQLKVVKVMLFEQVLKRTERTFPGQVFPERMKPMLYRLVQEYHEAIIQYMVQPENKARLVRQVMASEDKMPPQKNAPPRNESMIAKSHIGQYYKQEGRSGRVISLEFYKIADNAWRVYQHVGGHSKNWKVTVGRKWKTDTEAKEFLEQQGWKPI
ncbi:MAG TPA: hypothetical protein VFV38_17985 [Ktedonobacteraceae bacterium]|nr:hypothetical protein [Ktedonobacteraceae bacterium]